MSREFIKNLLGKADVKINGFRDWDLKVNNERFYSRVLAQGSIGLGDSYVDGWWDCKRIDELVRRLLIRRIDKEVKPSLSTIFNVMKARIFNLQSKGKSFDNGMRHYDLGNELYENMLDKRMVYTCAYWKNSKDLDSAQEAKLDLTCRKLKLKQGEKVLDIGCGWGSFMKFAAERYKVNVVGITVSKEQIALGKKLCKGLPVEFLLKDYRDVKGQFDKIVSLGMFEHVGPKNYDEYMGVAKRCLKDDGLFLLHTIGTKEKYSSPDPWLERHIFPNHFIPTEKQIVDAYSGIFVMEDWHNFGADYDRTLMAWHKNFNANWEKLKGKYDERFKRMWNYYMLVCAGNFRARRSQLWQIVFSKNGVSGGYESVR